MSSYNIAGGEEGDDHGIYSICAQIVHDHALHRVRLLRQPYTVFDGDPLPTKKGAEYERKQKCDEKGNALTSYGKRLVLVTFVGVIRIFIK